MFYEHAVDLNSCIGAVSPPFLNRLVTWAVAPVIELDLTESIKFNAAHKYMTVSRSVTFAELAGTSRGIEGMKILDKLSKETKNLGN
jgi:hypothetical protein